MSFYLLYQPISYVIVYVYYHDRLYLVSEKILRSVLVSNSVPVLPTLLHVGSTIHTTVNSSTYPIQKIGSFMQLNFCKLKPNRYYAGSVLPPYKLIEPQQKRTTLWYFNIFICLKIHNLLIRLRSLIEVDTGTGAKTDWKKWKAIMCQHPRDWKFLQKF